MSPSERSIKPDDLVIVLSLALPPQDLERHVIDPVGLMPTRNLMVLWDL